MIRLFEKREMGLKPKACSAPGCRRAFLGYLEAVSYCSEHFIAVCNRVMNELPIASRRDCPGNRAEMRRRLGQLADQVYVASLWSERLDRWEQIRILEVLERIGLELGRIRRGDRVPATVQIRIESKSGTGAWSEDSHTKQISPHGAILECAHRLRRGDSIALERLDVPRKALARIVWQGPPVHNRATTAIEIIDRLRYWD